MEETVYRPSSFPSSLLSLLSSIEGKVCGHYTQVVWSNTRRLSCSEIQCIDYCNFIVCDYDPPGNYAEM